jgi:hypothetical protein
MLPMPTTWCPSIRKSLAGVLRPRVRPAAARGRRSRRRGARCRVWQAADAAPPACHSTSPKRRGSRRRRALSPKRMSRWSCFSGAVRAARCAGFPTCPGAPAGCRWQSAGAGIWRGAPRPGAPGRGGWCPDRRVWGRRRRGLRTMAPVQVRWVSSGAIPRRVVSTSGSSGMGKTGGREELACWAWGNRLTSGEPYCSRAIQEHVAPLRACRDGGRPEPERLSRESHEAYFPPCSAGPLAGCPACFGRPAFAGVPRLSRMRPAMRRQSDLSGPGADTADPSPDDACRGGRSQGADGHGCPLLSRPGAAYPGWAHCPACRRDGLVSREADLSGEASRLWLELEPGSVQAQQLTPGRLPAVPVLTSCAPIWPRPWPVRAMPSARP